MIKTRQRHGMYGGGVRSLADVAPAAFVGALCRAVPTLLDRRDEEFNVKEKMTRRSDFITVDLPRDPLASLGVTGTLDRINMSDRTAMHFVSSIL